MLKCEFPGSMKPQTAQFPLFLTFYFSFLVFFSVANMSPCIRSSSIDMNIKTQQPSSFHFLCSSLLSSVKWQKLKSLKIDSFTAQVKNENTILKRGKHEPITSNRV